MRQSTFPDAAWLQLRVEAEQRSLSVKDRMETYLAKPKKKPKKKSEPPTQSIGEILRERLAASYNDGYRDALKLLKQTVDEQLRETK